MADILDNYRQMLARVNDLCQGIEGTLKNHISCSEGCSSCCKIITLFPVEAAYLNTALESLPADQAEVILHYVEQHPSGDNCPLLQDNRCLLYAARPVICRTHGLPILYLENSEKWVDCCPRNFVQCHSLPGTAIIDLERLNSLLVAVNAHFLSQFNLPEDFPERLTITEAVSGLGYARKFCDNDYPANLDISKPI